MQSKAQGAIEYLLIIGAAILVVTIVLIAITSVMQIGQEQNTTATTETNEATSGLEDAYKEAQGICTTKDWSYTDGECQSNNTLTRSWTKINSACKDEPTHALIETITCTYTPTCKGGTVSCASIIPANCTSYNTYGCALQPAQYACTGTAKCVSLSEQGMNFCNSLQPVCRWTAVPPAACVNSKTGCISAGSNQSLCESVPGCFVQTSPSQCNGSLNCTTLPQNLCRQVSLCSWN